MLLDQEVRHASARQRGAVEHQAREDRLRMPVCIGERGLHRFRVHIVIRCDDFDLLGRDGTGANFAVAVPVVHAELDGELTEHAPDGQSGALDALFSRAGLVRVRLKPPVDECHDRCRSRAL